MSKKIDLSSWDEEEIKPSSKKEKEINLSAWDKVDTEPDKEEVSKLESALRGSVQGATLGFGEELGAAVLTPIEALRRKISSLIPGTSENIDEELKAQGFTGDALESKPIYSELRDTARASDKAAREANPKTFIASEIAGGIAPGLLSGGGAAAANILKTGTKAAMLQGAKVGAGYGAGAGLGYGESDLTEGDILGAAKDVAVGGLTGAIGGAALPLAGKALKEGYKAGKYGTGKLFDALPESELMKAAFKYGKQGKKIVEDVVDEDLNQLGKLVYKNIRNAKESNNMQEVKAQLEKLGYKVNTKKAINEALDDMDKLANNDMLNMNNKEVVKKLKDFAGVGSDQSTKLITKAEKTAIKKQIESRNKAEQAVIKAEKELAKVEAKSGTRLETITDKKINMDDLEIPFDTKNGVIAGAKGNFKNPDKVLPSGEIVPGKKYSKTVISDATEYQPEILSLEGSGGRPIITTKDLGTGKVTALVGDINKKVTKDLDNMSISDVDALRGQLNEIIGIAKNAGSTKDPIIARAKQLAVQLKDLSDDVIAKSGDTSLINKRQRFSDIFSAEELLGIDKRFAGRTDINDALLSQQISNKLGFSKGYKTRQESDIAKKLLGKDILSQETSTQYDLLKKVNMLLGRESQENISRAGLYKTAVGFLPNVTGRASKKVSDIASKVTSPVSKSMNAISKMSNEKIAQTAQRLAASGNKGKQLVASQLEKYMTTEGAAKGQLLWAISQNPATRNLIGREAEGFNEGLQESLGINKEDQINIPFTNEPKFEDGGIVEGYSEEVEKEIDRVNQQQSSGDQMPISHIDGLLEKIDNLNISQESKDQIENEAITMESFSDGQRLKDMIRNLR